MYAELYDAKLKRNVFNGAGVIMSTRVRFSYSSCREAALQHTLELISLKSEDAVKSRSEPSRRRYANAKRVCLR